MPDVEFKGSVSAWPLAVAWGCAWSLPWLLGSALPCFVLGWLPAWCLAGAVLMRSRRAAGSP